MEAMSAAGDVSYQDAGAEWVEGNELVEVAGHRGHGLLRRRDVRPLEASTSALITFAPLIFTPLDVSILTISPSTVLADLSFTTSAAVTLPATTW
jgi:hypothetical protein